MRSSLHAVPLLLATLVLPACGDAGRGDLPELPASAAAAEPADAMRVLIVEPAEGATVEGPVVRVVLEVGGLRVVPAGDTSEGSGHHHLFLDADVSDAGAPIPSVPGSVVHMGDGSTEYAFEGLGPGEHRLIAVVGDGAHVPLDPWVVDTVRFTVR